MRKKQLSAEERSAIVSQAVANGINKTAVENNLSYATVKKWVDLFQQSGENGLVNRSRLEQHHPDKMDAALTQRILATKEQNPTWSAAKIVDFLGLACSVQTVNKKLRQSGLRDKIAQVSRDIAPFEILVADIFRLDDYYHNADLPDYQISVIDYATNAFFVGFAFEKSNIDIAIFMDYVLEYFSSCGLNTQNVTIITGMGQEFVSYSRKNSSLCTNIIRQKYSAVEHPKPFKEKMKYLKNRLLFNKSQFNNLNDLLYKSFALTLHHNHFTPQRNHNNQTAVEILTELNPLLNKKILNLPVIIVDYHIKDIDRIKVSNNYWQMNNESIELVIKKTFDHFMKISRGDKQNFNTTEALNNYEMMINLAKISNSVDVQVAGLQQRAYLYQLTGEWGKSQIDNSSAYDLLQNCSNSKVKIGVMRTLGRQQLSEFKTEEAITTFSQALEIAKTTADKKNMALIYNELGAVYKIREDYTAAESAYRQALSIAEQERLGITAALVYGNLALTAFRHHDYLEEKRLIYKSIELCTKFKHWEGLIANYLNLGAHFAGQDEYQQALESYVCAFKLVRKTGYRSKLMKIYLNIGILFIKTGKYTRAAHYFKKQIELAMRIGDENLLAVSYENLAVNCFYLNDIKSAYANLDLAFRGYQQINSPRTLDIIYFQSRFLYSEKKYLQAQKLLKKHRIEFNNSNDDNLKHEFVLMLSLLNFLQHLENKNIIKAREEFTNLKIYQLEIQKQNSFGSLTAQKSKEIDEQIEYCRQLLKI